MKKTSPVSRSGRFAGGPAADVAQFTESISFDRRLWRQDIAGSMAHATMLRKAGFLTHRELRAIIRGLDAIGKEIKAGKFRWQPELEDVHMNIEAALTRRVPAGAKLHTGRSRNDQVALDMRLWLREQIAELQREIRLLQRALVRLGEREREVIIPGYTHLQRAQPVYLAHHLLAYVEMLARDAQRLAGMLRAGERLPARQRRAGRLDAAARPRAGGRVARLCGCARKAAADAELDGRGERPGFRGGVLRQRGAARGAPVAAGGRPGPLVEQRIQLHPYRRRLHHRLVADAAEEESRRGGADPGQERPGDRQPGGAADAAQGLCR